jgi:hypothetical protein
MIIINVVLKDRTHNSAKQKGKMVKLISIFQT